MQHPPSPASRLYLHIVLAVLLVLLPRPLHTWRLVSKPCPSDCGYNGNCNHELGMCECNFGWIGPTCSEMVLGACRSSDSLTALVMYGTRWPKSCECHRQIVNYSYIPEQRGQRIPLSLPYPGAVRYCFEREGVPPEQQFSDVPLANASGVKWYQPTLDLNSEPGKDDWLVFTEVMPRPDDVTDSWFFKVLLPLSYCPDRCNDRGACYAPGTCMCRKGFMGPSCGELDNRKSVFGDDVWGERSCLNGCSGVGQCWAGFCKCPPGVWGMDCSRSKAYEPDPDSAIEVQDAAYSRSVLRIYRYEVPSHIAFHLEYNDGSAKYDEAYASFEKFFQLFANDWVVRTDNPWEANLFYLPILNVFHSTTHIHSHVWLAMRYIQDNYPQIWNRNQGRDHFMWLPNDLGACQLFDDPLVQAPIKLVHFGLQVSTEQYTHMPWFQWAKDNPTNKQYSCYKKEKDVVPMDTNVPEGSREVTDAPAIYELALNSSTAEREYLLYFGGSFRLHEPQYSGGARQAYHDHVHIRNHPRVKYGSLDHAAVRDSTFCFAPYGDGWGNRISHIILGACIPVIVQEHVHQPFDEILPYTDFSLRLRVKDMPNLLEILEGISLEQIQQYRQNMYKHYKAFYWYDGGQAYNYTLASLYHKLPNIWGKHLRRQYRRAMM